jgi:hypothetical protein
MVAVHSNSVVFFVQVWGDARGFHATVRDVSREDTTTFDNAATLARFFASSCPAANASSPPSPPLESDEVR